MNEKYDWTLATIAAILVLFTAMLDPVISVVLAVVCLLGLSAYTFIERRKHI